jgi:hypothetical protein
MKLLAFLVLLVSITIQAQVQLKGKVSDEFGFVISDCLVYIDGSSISTYTDSNGDYNLTVSSGNYTLVFRKEEYSSQIIQVIPTQSNYDVILTKTTIELDEAVIVPISKEDWAFYFQTFKSYFLGKNQAGQKCEILNPKVIKFNFDKSNRVLTARAIQPLVIKNDFLGYQIQYDLDEFYVDYKNNLQYMAGTSLFSPLKGSSSKQKTWEKNRENSYRGSIMHFIRSLYNQNLKEEGFEINRLIRSENPDYTAYMDRIQTNRELGIKENLGKMPSKLIETLIREEIPYSNFIYKRNNRIFVHFQDFMNVEFKKEKEDPLYVQMQKSQQLIGNQVSVISLIGDKVIEIDANGNFYPATNLLAEEYFTWEKIGNLLPLDYELN